MFDEILTTFTRTDKSITHKSIADLQSKILRFLQDIKPEGRKDIELKYDSIQKQINDIAYAIPQDSSDPSKQEKAIATIYMGILELKNSMEDLVEALQDYVEMNKEEKE
jgi:hypothetical protein